jgi:hypothetical protein
VDQVCDSAYGNVFTVSGFAGPSCAKGSQCNTSPNNLAGGYCGNSGTTCGAITIPATGATTATCTFTAGPQAEKTPVTNVASVKGHATLNTTRTFSGVSNSVQVTSTELPTTATTTKGVVGTQAACATVRYSVDVKNTSSPDESVLLSVLTDNAFGDVTKCTNTNCANSSGANGSLQILGTTCGVATTSSGLGTLSGSSGAGALPFTIPVDANNITNHYQCQFDAQFCSALDNMQCISQSDTVKATVRGDESDDVAFTQASNQITVKECLIQTVTSP